MGYRLNIIRDDYAESPRDWDNLGTMYCEHSRYMLGDTGACDIRNDEGLVPDNYIWLPLYLYDHSGITMRTNAFSCVWDSGQVGYIYVSKDKIRKDHGWKHITKKRIAKIEEHLVSEVAVYDQFLTGDVYGYKLVEFHDDGAETELDSCWGFFGEDPAVNGMADYLPVPLDQVEVCYS